MLDPIRDNPQLVRLDPDLDSIVNDSLASNQNLERHFSDKFSGCVGGLVCWVAQLLAVDKKAKIQTSSVSRYSALLGSEISLS